MRRNAGRNGSRTVIDTPDLHAGLTSPAGSTLHVTIGESGGLSVEVKQEPSAAVPETLFCDRKLGDRRHIAAVRRMLARRDSRPWTPFGVVMVEREFTRLRLNDMTMEDFRAAVEKRVRDMNPLAAQCARRGAVLGLGRTASQSRTED